MSLKSHFANVGKSDRLKRLLKELSDGQKHSTLELQQSTGSMAIHSDIHELRCNNYPVKTTYGGLSAEGRKVFHHQLEV
jgi:hypothetical protein